MNKRHYEHTLPNIRGSLSNTYDTFLYRRLIIFLPGGLVAGPGKEDTENTLPICRRGRFSSGKRKWYLTGLTAGNRTLQRK